MTKITKAAGNILGGILGTSTPAIDIPAPEVPAPPAPTRRTDTGAIITVGSDNIKNSRVSGRRRSSGGGDVLGGSGFGAGLNI